MNTGDIAVRSTTIGHKNEDHPADILAELQAQADADPDVLPCRIEGWALSESRKGMAVRKAPDDEAAVVERLAPPNGLPQREPPAVMSGKGR